MSTITINGTKYDTDALSDKAKAELMSIQICDQRISTMKADLAIAQTARIAYAHALNGLLPKTAPKAKAKAKPKAKKA